MSCDDLYAHLFAAKGCSALVEKEEQHVVEPCLQIVHLAVEPDVLLCRVAVLGDLRPCHGSSDTLVCLEYGTCFGYVLCPDGIGYASLTYRRIRLHLDLYYVVLSGIDV